MKNLSKLNLFRIQGYQMKAHRQEAKKRKHQYFQTLWTQIYESHHFHRQILSQKSIHLMKWALHHHFTTNHSEAQTMNCPEQTKWWHKQILCKKSWAKTKACSCGRKRAKKRLSHLRSNRKEVSRFIDLRTSWKTSVQRMKMSHLTLN